MAHILAAYFNLNLTKMKKVKLVFGLLMLVVFSLSFAMDNNSSADNDKQEAVKKGIPLPPNG